MTTDENSRARCFSKIPKSRNPLVLIPNVGEYLRFEMTQMMPVVRINRLREKIRYQFNEALGKRSFKFSDKYQAILVEQEAEMAEDTKRFVERSFDTLGLFQDLGCHSSDSNSIDAHINEIATSQALVRRIYNIIISDNDPYFPHRVLPQQLGKNWATYRWVQTHVIYGLLFHKRYSGQVPNGAGQSFWRSAEHEIIDANYVILGVLAGGIATGDARVAKTFKLLCPKGYLFPAPSLRTAI